MGGGAVRPGVPSFGGLALGHRAVRLLAAVSEHSLGVPTLCTPAPASHCAQRTVGVPGRLSASSRRRGAGHSRPPVPPASWWAGGGGRSHTPLHWLGAQPRGRPSFRTLYAEDSEGALLFAVCGHWGAVLLPSVPLPLFI